MTESDLFSAIGGAEEEDLAQSRRTPSHPWRKWAVAACLCLAVGGAALALPHLSGMGESDTAAEANDVTGDSGEEDDYSNPGAAVQSAETPETNVTAEGNEAADGVTVPAVTLPASDSDEVSDMEGVLVYQGRVYTESLMVSGAEAEPLLSLLGEKLGTASGTLDEWSTQDDYAAEFASDCTGEVYTVEGYDPSFRLAIVEETESGTRLSFLENLNGITLTTGADLFEDRLHLSENLVSVTCETWESWNHENDKQNPLTGCTDEEWSAFLAAVGEAPFVDLCAEDSGIYQSDGQVFLYCALSDGTTVQLRLLEGGYVGYQPLFGCFVKLPEEIFNPVYQAACASGDYNSIFKEEQP